MEKTEEQMEKETTLGKKMLKMIPLPERLSATTSTWGTWTKEKKHLENCLEGQGHRQQHERKRGA